MLKWVVLVVFQAVTEIIGHESSILRAYVRCQVSGTERVHINFDAPSVETVRRQVYVFHPSFLVVCFGSCEHFSRNSRFVAPVQQVC